MGNTLKMENSFILTQPRFRGDMPYPAELRGYVTREEWDDFQRSTANLPRQQKWDRFNERFDRPERCNLTAKTWPCHHFYMRPSEAIGTRRLRGNTNIPMRHKYSFCGPGSYGEFEYIDDDTIDHPDIPSASYSHIVDSLNAVVDKTRTSYHRNICSVLEMIAMFIFFPLLFCFIHQQFKRSQMLRQTVQDEIDVLNRTSALCDHGYELRITSLIHTSTNTFWPIVVLHKGKTNSMDRGLVILK